MAGLSPLLISSLSCCGSCGFRPEPSDWDSGLYTKLCGDFHCWRDAVRKKLHEWSASGCKSAAVRSICSCTLKRKTDLEFDIVWHGWWRGDVHKLICQLILLWCSVKFSIRCNTIITVRFCRLLLEFRSARWFKGSCLIRLSRSQL